MLNFKELRLFQLYCDNRVDFEMFKEAQQMQDDSYSLEKWKLFRKEPVRFISSEGRESLFNWIQEKIELTGYKG